jgi:hypothetical protein
MVMTSQARSRKAGHNHKKPEPGENQKKMLVHSSILARKLDLLEKTVNLLISRLNEQEKAVRDLMESHGLLWACGSLDFSEVASTGSERKGRGQKK